MIGKVPPPYQPTVSTKTFNVTQNSSSGALKDSINRNFIKIDNSSEKLFRVLGDEFLLAQKVRSNKNLENISNIESQPNLKGRLVSLGITVTAVYNWGDDGEAKNMANKICELLPRAESGDMRLDPVIPKRGKYFIHSLVKKDHPLNATIYSQCLGFGHKWKEDRYDQLTLDHFQTLWGLSRTAPPKN